MEQPIVETLSPRLEPAFQVLGARSHHSLAVAFHPTANFLVSAGEDGTIRVWDWHAGVLQRTLLGHTKAVSGIDFDSGGNLLVSCSSDQTISIWDIQNDWELTKTLLGHEHTVSSVRFMPGDQQIVSCGRDATVSFWDVASGDLVRTLRLRENDAPSGFDWIRCVQPSVDGQAILIGLNTNVFLKDAQTGEVLVKFVGHLNVVNAVAFAPLSAYPAIRMLAGQEPIELSEGHGRYMASAARDHTIILWDCKTGEKLKTLTGHDNWVRAIAFHPRGQHLLSVSDDYTIRVWDLKSGQCVRVVEAHTHFVLCMAMAPHSGKLSSVVASGSLDDTVKIWDVSEWSPDIPARM
ncbi:hypothetical protein FOMPIDRAFT_136311 [Fomitopsis schrenkii]|uniref:Uncharacterized protein n=1 Tax=Fomitopsis schrenkii TaxID=2126942 RepID=S8G1B0_FOMSC|nr:hypothetical protein FOMPIDRAFT_136311 [Fomitopsis schrenkii]